MPEVEEDRWTGIRLKLLLGERLPADDANDLMREIDRLTAVLKSLTVENDELLEAGKQLGVELATWKAEEFKTLQKQARGSYYSGYAAGWKAGVARVFDYMQVKKDEHLSPELANAAVSAIRDQLIAEIDKTTP